MCVCVGVCMDNLKSRELWSASKKHIEDAQWAQEEIYHLGQWRS